MINQLGKSIADLVIPSRRLNKKWSSLQYIVQQKDFTAEFQKENAKIQEIEHQVGRFINMQKVFSQLSVEEPGDVLEFGTWQGLGLILFSRLLGQNIQNRKLIGIDSFEGLPHDSTIWKKSQFNNTSLQTAKDNFERYGDKRFNRQQCSFVKGWFNSKETVVAIKNLTKSIEVIHFDADLGSSTREALALIQPILENRKAPTFFLFDDWGCHPDEVPDAFFEWLEAYRKKNPVEVVKFSSTRFTRY